MSARTVQLEEVAEFINGRAFKPSEWSQSGTPIIRIQNLTGTSKVFNYFDGEFDERIRVQRGDILISWSASLGVYRWRSKDAVLNQHIFKVRLHNGINPDYFYYAATDAVQEMALRVHGSTMQHITKDRFDSIHIPLPDLVEQRRVAALLEQADRLRHTRRYALDLSATFLPATFLELFGDPRKTTTRWQTEQLENLGTLERGRSKHRPRNAPHLYGGRYPFIQTGDVANAEGYIRNHSQSYSEDGLKQSKLWVAGTLCITIAANIGKTAILTYPACFPDSIVGFIPGERVKIEFVPASIPSAEVRSAGGAP